ncbi:MAG: DEAD/DEAH box helicase [Firmicutes bacterium]|nr:DEAD/DEAH box helicase [Bacillota bacterium]
MEIPLKTFPITVPIMTFNWEAVPAGPPQEDFTEGEMVDDLFAVKFSRDAVKEVILAVRRGRWGTWADFKLAWLAHVINAKGWQDLHCPRSLGEHWRKAGVVPYPHQLNTLKTVVQQMHGRAILADEVGLGKTIEAGMVLKEYILRGMVHKTLILTPSSLCYQWYNELREKFLITPWLQRTDKDWERAPILIASLDTAKRSPHREIVLSQEYDMLIVDEAHKLKNDRTQNWQLVNSIKRKFCLLLTATPVQNDLKELYNLITLLKPGQLGIYRSFREKFMEDRRIPKNVGKLRHLLEQTMIRNRRGVEGVYLPNRMVNNQTVELSPEERQLYDGVKEFVQGEYHRCLASGGNPLPLITLQREVCSSFHAAYYTLAKMYESGRVQIRPLLELASTIEKGAKLLLLEDLIKGLGERVLIFTEYRATQEYLRYHLEQAGFITVGFDGSLSPGKKEWIRRQFQEHADIMVSTECGGEGLNFQFCCNVVNFDLPWNPMRLEQRIGRVHRLGQRRDVNIFNLVTLNTIEEHILYLLHEKIGMFEMVVGELDAILAGADGTLEGSLAQILLASGDSAELRAKLDGLADRLLSNRRQDPLISLI